MHPKSSELEKTFAEQPALMMPWLHRMSNTMSETNSATDGIFFIPAKIHIHASCSHPGLKWRAWSDLHFHMIIGFNRVRNTQTPLCVSAHIAQLLHAGKSNYHFKRASEAELAEKINVWRRAGVISFPQIWRYPFFKLLKSDRGTVGDRFGKNSQSLDNEERLSFRMLWDRRQCFPET